MRNGTTRLELPIFGPDLGGGEFARSGIRGAIRFVRSDTGIGAYSTKPKLRSHELNRGAIVKVSDQKISYFVTEVTKREEKDSNGKSKKFGPLLPYSDSGSASGSVTVSASMEEARPATRAEVDDVMLKRGLGGTPTKWPLFWSHENRLSNWLMRETAPIFYELSGETAEAYKDLSTVAQELGRRGGCYIDHGERAIFGAESNKGNAGASKLMDRRSMEVGLPISVHFHLNFNPVTFAFSSGYIHFFPEEVVVADASGACNFIPYSDLRNDITEGTQLGVEVPSWCEPVGYTWQYMNRDGGPDRRYSYNPQIPHYRAWELDFTFPGGRIDTAFADRELMERFRKQLDRLITLSKSRKEK